MECVDMEYVGTIPIPLVLFMLGCMHAPKDVNWGGRKAWARQSTAVFTQL